MFDDIKAGDEVIVTITRRATVTYVGTEPSGRKWLTVHYDGTPDGYHDNVNAYDYINVERVHLVDVDAVVQGYEVCALWSSLERDDGEPLDAIYDRTDFSDEARARNVKDVKAFLEEASGVAVLSQLEASQIGHDFWLTRNHHGAGFWDRGLGDDGEALSEISQRFGEIDIEVGDDGALHLLGGID